jgi:hypothetical protein
VSTNYLTIFAIVVTKMKVLLDQAPAPVSGSSCWGLLIVKKLLPPTEVVKANAVYGLKGTQKPSKDGIASPLLILGLGAQLQQKKPKLDG